MQPICDERAVDKTELLRWASERSQVHCSRFEDLSSGAVWLRLFHVVFPRLSEWRLPELCSDSVRFNWDAVGHAMAVLRLPASLFDRPGLETGAFRPTFALLHMLYTLDRGRTVGRMGFAACESDSEPCVKGRAAGSSELARVAMELLRADLSGCWQPDMSGPPLDSQVNSLAQQLNHARHRPESTPFTSPQRAEEEAPQPSPAMPSGEFCVAGDPVTPGAALAPSPPLAPPRSADEFVEATCEGADKPMPTACEVSCRVRLPTGIWHTARFEVSPDETAADVALDLVETLGLGDDDETFAMVELEVDRALRAATEARS